MEREGLFVDPSESEETRFRKAPEAFHPVHMCATPHKFIFAMINPEMFAVPHINQAILPPPPIRIDHTVQGDLASNNRLQCGFSTVMDQFGVDLTVPLENAKDNCFPIRPSYPFSFEASCAKIGFIDFHLSAEGRLTFTKLRDVFSHSSYIPVHGIAIQSCQEGHL
jgi:hypothetical protein